MSYGYKPKNCNTMQVDKQEIVAKFKIFQVLTPEQKAFLYKKLTPIKLPKYEFLYHRGIEAREIYLLYSGNIKLGKMAGDGREIIKEVLHANSILGTSILHGQNLRQDFAQALNTDAKLLKLDSNALRHLMSVNHNFSLNIIKLLSKKLSILENRIAGFMAYDARGRIIEFIKKTANEQGRRVGTETLIRHSLTQQEIANITGTSRQTVTHVLNQLKKSNLIYFNRKSILVRDLAKLA